MAQNALSNSRTDLIIPRAGGQSEKVVQEVAVKLIEAGQ
jgi:hypothetical protein